MFENILPEELINIIYKKLHKLYMKDICIELDYCVSWIRLKTGKYSFIVGKDNYYRSLLYLNKF